ncbi:TPA: TM2 domain-containing protein [Streptococcus suis]|nr:TM2 domain-containing protein [Streptococcus suis]
MSQFTDSYLAANASNLPAESLPMIRQRLDELNEAQTSYVLSAELKNPTTALIFSILLGGFGADRFYIGQAGLGAAKLGLVILYWLTIWFGIGLLFSPVFIWIIVDYFLIMNATKKVNLETLNTAIAAATLGR